MPANLHAVCPPSCILNGHASKTTSFYKKCVCGVCCPGTYGFFSTDAIPVNRGGHYLGMFHDNFLTDLPSPSTWPYMSGPCEGGTLGPQTLLNVTGSTTSKGIQDPKI